MLNRRQPIHDWQLTDRELEIAHGVKGLPKQIMAELRSEGANLLVRTTALTKLRKHMEAERLLHEEVAKFEGYRDLHAKAETLQATVEMQRDELAKAHRELEQLKKKLERTIAAPAMAISGEPTSR